MRWDRFKRRPLVALQVEVSSRCTRRCAICPRTPLAEVWRDGDLGDATWERLRDDLSLARHVHLQGWGEPLLHPRLPEMADTAKAAGCKVGLTTNGDLLADALDWIVAGSVDQVTLSVAGDETTHAALRDGSTLEESWTAVERLITRRRRTDRPRVQVSYLLTRANSGQLPGVIQAAAAAGADEFFATHLDCTPSPELLDEAAFSGSELRPEVAESLAAAKRQARSSGIPFRAPASASQELLVCALDPLHFVFVGWDGRVGPCVNLALPISGSIPRCHAGGRSRVDPVIFGDLGRESLRRILAGERFRRFGAPFESRLAAERRLLAAATEHRGAQALAQIEEADRRRVADLVANPFPDPCAGCHKVLGW